MPPVKFDDIPKTASEVLGDDYVSGYQFKTKQKTSWDGAVISTATDLWKEGDEKVKTPAKLTWKFPKPLGVAYVSVDKLEMDAKGKLKLEASSEKVMPGLKVDCKSDCEKMTSFAAGCTYTGLKDTQIKLETKPTSLAKGELKDTTAEVTNTQGIATIGLKCTGATLTSPDLGIRVAQGPFFGSLLVKSFNDKEKPTVFSKHMFFKASEQLKVATAFEYACKDEKKGTAAKQTYSVGILYEVMKGLKLRAKVAQDKSVSASVKYDLSKGFSLLGGAKYTPDKKTTYGFQVSIE